MPVSFSEKITGTLFIISLVVYKSIIYSKVSLLVITFQTKNLRKRYFEKRISINFKRIKSE